MCKKVAVVRLVQWLKRLEIFRDDCQEPLLNDSLPRLLGGKSMRVMRVPLCGCRRGTQTMIGDGPQQWLCVLWFLWSGSQSLCLAIHIAESGVQLVLSSLQGPEVGLYKPKDTLPKEQTHRHMTQRNE